MSNITENVSTEQLKELDRKHFLHPTTAIKQHQENGPTLIIEEGEGIYLTDINGNKYIDGMSSLWNVNVGHGREELAEVAKEQMKKLAFSSCFQGMSHEPVIRLAKKLSTLTPGDLNVSFFTSGGSESNDTAFKLVRHYWKLKGETKRTKIIALKRGYHGITVGATSATGIEQFQNMATAQAPDFIHATTRFKTDCELGDRTDSDFAGSVRGVIESEGADTVAAVILEPIQGAGGMFIPPDGYLQAIRDLCDEYGILMITDEVICGFGRTGKMFGVDNWNVVPDVMTVAKGITSAYSQLGAVIIRETLRDELSELSDGMFFHGFTYSGHPVACAVALKNIEIIEREDLVSNAKQMEAVLKKGFEYLEEKYPFVTKTRAIGLLAAFELYKDRENEIPFDPSLAVAPKLVQECLKRGLVVRPVIFEGSNTIVMAPPLTTTKEQVEEMIQIFDDSLSAIEKSICEK
ncbi:aminotransferase class III-fold pyridoxal phosphate-dependent enzyme [Bacillus aerolatus]|uniref:Aminotransferase class III-fold pyridoxal phosphate-dependent enzyme n=1 Tax=Bacillus aerolatus TaxID=2653354 RepID=A0A6I1FIG0_9BACI|nr:aspartate aminotransferase family protein [Bacillus aerolatus]KAB7705516.1 aminotransferase class III-fold pyridoxal phosphate-dependent enzyme [Bacillus aerolatus]